MTGDVDDEFHCSYFTTEQIHFIEQKYTNGINTKNETETPQCLTVIMELTSKILLSSQKL